MHLMNVCKLHSRNVEEKLLIDIALHDLVAIQTFLTRNAVRVDLFLVTTWFMVSRSSHGLKMYFADPSILSLRQVKLILSILIRNTEDKALAFSKL